MRKIKKKPSLYLLVTVLVIIFSLYENFTGNSISKINKAENELSVTAVDVGQGDCIVAILPDDKVLMIDAGENGYEDNVFGFLDNNNITKIDYLVATHPHSDHIGSMPEVISEYEIGSFYMPKVSHSSKTFEDMIDVLSRKGMKINVAKAGKTIFDDDGIKAEFISPVKEEYEDLNNYSCAIKLTYHNKSFLFTGDMEELSENEVMSANLNVDADVLKVAHHGSSTSSSEAFLKKVSPEFCVISCGVDNDYNHPHKEVMERLSSMCDNIYRTDTDGDVTFITDGKVIRVE